MRFVFALGILIFLFPDGKVSSFVFQEPYCTVISYRPYAYQIHLHRVKCSLRYCLSLRHRFTKKCYFGFTSRLRASRRKVRFHFFYFKIHFNFTYFLFLTHFFARKFYRPQILSTQSVLNMHPHIDPKNYVVQDCFSLGGRERNILT